MKSRTQPSLDHERVGAAMAETRDRLADVVAAYSKTSWIGRKALKLQLELQTLASQLDNDTDSNEHYFPRRGKEHRA